MPQEITSSAAIDRFWHGTGVVEIHHRSMPGPGTERSPISATSPQRAGDTPKQLAPTNLCFRMVTTMPDHNEVGSRRTRTDGGRGKRPGQRRFPTAWTYL